VFYLHAVSVTIYRRKIGLRHMIRRLLTEM